jgi:hypothetical protein
MHPDDLPTCPVVNAITGLQYRTYEQHMKGNWGGYYKHESELIPEERRNQHTHFKITIDRFDGKIFSGTVEDDAATGGTPGVGEIKGVKDGLQIAFIKKMPVETILLPNGERITRNRKHPTIYYSGTISHKESYMTGTWKFKSGWIWFGILPVPRAPISGIWKMYKTE